MIMRISVTVHLIDDLTGLAVTGSNARVWIEKQKPPIKKDGGVSVFTDLPEGRYTIIAEGGQYARTETVCTVNAEGCTNITIRLVPNRVYPVPSDAVRIEGRAFPRAAVRIWQSDRTSALKLLSDAEKGSSVIGIYTNSEINIVGKLLKIASSADKSEYIRVLAVGNKERSEYILDRELIADYPKIGTAVMQVSECRADDNGDFMLLIKKGSGDALVCEAETAENNTNIQKNLDLGGKTCIKADLTK